MAKELRAGAEYAKECLKLYGQNVTAQFAQDTIGLFENSLIPELRQLVQRQKESIVSCQSEQKYKDTAQELCAKAGCKTGSILHQVCIALITYGAKQAVQSLPPISPAPQAAAVGPNGTVAVPVANTVADTVELVGGIVLMSGQHGSGGDASGSHSEAPQASRDEKLDVVYAKGTKQWTPEVEEVVKHNSTFKTQAAADASRLEVEFLEDKLPHIFEEREGHLPDLPENRKLILEVASDPKNYFATSDKYGTTWCEKFLDDGSPVWVTLRAGKIRDAGINYKPIKWNSETGFCSLTIPKK